MSKKWNDISYENRKNILEIREYNIINSIKIMKRKININLNVNKI